MNLPMKMRAKSKTIKFPSYIFYTWTTTRRSGSDLGYISDLKYFNQENSPWVYQIFGGLLISDVVKLATKISYHI